MFELSNNDSSASGISGLTKRNMGIDMNSLKSVLVNCPGLLTGMSHEMRTHMNAIVAFSFLMKDDSCNISDREEFSTQILSSCEQLIGLFDSFLDSAIIDTGNSKADLRLCDLNKVLDELLSEFRETIRKEVHKGLDLITDNQDSDLPEVFIDTNRVFRVIRSLFQNSIKNTKAGYIKIGYSFRDDNLTFYVLDSGQGYFKCREFLQSDDLNESLAQYNDTFTAINITLARKLIQMMAGNIWIEKNGIAGSAVYFTLPAKRTGKQGLESKYVKSMSIS